MILASNHTPSNSTVANLSDFISWLETGDTLEVVGYSRTSPTQTDAPRQTPSWQRHEIEAAAQSNGLRLDSFYYDEHRDSRTVTKGSRPELFKAIDYATRRGCPIVAFEWRRFGRGKIAWQTLADLPIPLLTITPMSTPPKALDAVCKRAANRYFRKTDERLLGGRPRNMIDCHALPYIMSQLGRPWTQIARELGEGWSDKKVKRVLQRYFRYETS